MDPKSAFVSLEPQHLLGLGALVALLVMLLALVGLSVAVYAWGRSWLSRFERILLERRDNSVRIEASLAEPNADHRDGSK